MLFVSFNYFIFLFSIVLIYWLIPHHLVNYRCSFLILANFFYYCWWDWRFSILLLGLSGIAFGSSLWINTLPDGKKKKMLLTASLSLIFSSLIFFKYYNFFIDSFGQALNFTGISVHLTGLNLILPLGISFYTFQLAGYVLDIYWEKTHPEKNPLIFFAFSSFFPVILSGPIERSTNLLKQLRIQSIINWENISEGLKMILWGLFTKMVISDNLSAYINTVYSDPSQFNTLTLLYTAILFMIMLYADFMGYSNIAIGSAKLLGFDLIKNFNLPFFSSSFSEFWRRWHISLTTWFFDYIFNPLNFSLRKYKKIGIVLSLMVVFLVSGFWHGAAWTFVVWGIMHGIFLNLEVILDLKKRVWSKITNKYLLYLTKFSNILFVFIIVSLIAVFFRSNSLKDSLIYFNTLFSFSAGPVFMGISAWSFYLNLLLIIFLFSTEFLQSRNVISINFSPSRLPVWVRWPAYAFLIFAIMLYGKTDSSFIYFQF